MARPVIGNIHGTGGSEPIIKVPSGEEITIRSTGWEFIISDSNVKINNKKTGKTVFKIDDTGVLIGDPYGEHIKLKQ
ncbi:MAG: hypothetical protein EKK63_10930 [Acinetobacter sp.]|uniref:hypothetical protein n=1 Tax=Acinetobacter sp. TaxID=472 RepID=UPI000FC23E93|nr:hypothetical protein [Acinetobacter sp.]RUP38880.1 MAG: hypothetical protein EKK63_10930 [Acinetobacter sp.]